MTTLFQGMADHFPGKLELLEEGEKEISSQWFIRLRASAGNKSEEGEKEISSQWFIRLRATGRDKSEEFTVTTGSFPEFGWKLVCVSHGKPSSPDVIVSELPYAVLLVACGDLSSWKDD
jgi:hypothetical protein